VDFWALGVNVDAGGMEADGTSASAPFVTGIAALWLSRFPHLTNSELRQAMRDWSLDVTPPPPPPPPAKSKSYIRKALGAFVRNITAKQAKEDVSQDKIIVPLVPSI